VPLLWGIRNPRNFTIAIDWQDSLAFNPFSILPDHHTSYVELKKEKNELNGSVTIQECFDIFSKEENVELECDKCKLRVS